MAQIKNTFVKSKMNRDLDARLIPNGEYREGRNIGVSKSEGSDVGALENVKGNASVLPGFINKLNAGLTPNEKPLEVIGLFTHEDSSSIYMFLTTFTDASKNQLSNNAYLFNSHCYITRVKYNGNLSTTEERRYESSILVEGSFLNFSKTHPISGFNIVEDLMFFTDNRNQPRKINIEKAAGRAFSTGSNVSKPFYYNEDQISVAKYYPYNSFSLIRKDGSNYSSTIKNTTTEFLPISLSAPLDEIKTVGGYKVLNFLSPPLPPAPKPKWTGTSASNSSIANFFSKNGGNDYPVVRIKNAQKPGSQDIYIYSVLGNEVSVASSQTTLTTQINVPNAPGGSYNVPETWAEPGDVIVFQLKNPDFDISFDGDTEFLKDKFPRFSYRFKYTDNEYSLMAPFTQTVFMPAQDGSITWQDEDTAVRTTELAFFENRASEIGLIIDLPYYPGISSTSASGFFNGELQRELNVDEIEILFKTSNDNNIYIIESLDISEGCSNDNLVSPDGTTVASRNQFIYKYKGAKPYKVVPETDVTRVNDIIPVRALAQETSGNRIMYGNYLDNHALPPEPHYEAASSLKKGSFSPDFNESNNPPIATTLNNKIKEYYNATVKQGRTYQVGVVFSDRYGRQSTVMLASESGVYGNKSSDRSTVLMPYDNSGSTTTLNFFGSSLKMDWHKEIPDIEAYNILNYPGLYNNFIRPNGWYTYKIVIKQQEQEYYNVFAPGSMSGNVVYKDNETLLGYSDSWNTSNLSLYGDNINKIPRDMTNVGPTDRIYGSKESLYYRVIQPNYNFHAQSVPATVDTNRWNSRQTVLPIIESTVVSIQPFLDMGKWVNQKGVSTTNAAGTAFVGSLSYPGAYNDGTDNIPGTVNPFVKSDNNPFIATVNNNGNKDRVGFLNTTQTSKYDASNTPPLNLAKFSESLIIAETKPVLSNLELYWETTTSGLISDLNSSIRTAGNTNDPGNLTTWLFKGQENIEYTGANLANCLLSKNINIATIGGVENQNPNYTIVLDSVSSRGVNGVLPVNGLFLIKEFSGTPKNYNLYLTSEGIDSLNALQYNSSDNTNVWNNEFIFNFTLSITVGLDTTTATVSKANNFFSNAAPTLGATPNPSTIEPGSSGWNGDTWAFSIGGEEPDSGQTDYNYIKQEHLFSKTSGNYEVTSVTRNQTRNRNQQFFTQDKWTQYNSGTPPYPVFPNGKSSTGWNNGSFAGLNSGSELYIEKLECAVFKSNDTVKFGYEEWWPLKKLGVTQADIDSDSHRFTYANKDWFTSDTIISANNPVQVDLSAATYGSQNLRYTYFDYPWKLEFVEYNTSSPAPWLAPGSISGGSFESGWYLFADGQSPPFEWQGGATAKNDRRFWAEGFLNGGRYSVHKITIGVKETFPNGQVSQVGQMVVYTKLYR